TLSRKKHLLLPLRFRAKNICCCRYAFAQKTSVAAATLSRKKHLLLPLRFRAKNICCCRYVSTTLSHKKHLPLTLRFRAKNICRPKHKADSGRNYTEA
ncbi:hypothetical protein, partial [Lysinibacillus sp. RC79]|uniref:hypothetical protein n=1 Tax=Lysinibacillus sp. RC79 TaxID=3156296 RepID=UPI003515044F